MVLLGSLFSSFRSFVLVGFGVLRVDFVVSLFYLCLVVFTSNDRSILCLNLLRNLFKNQDQFWIYWNQDRSMCALGILC